MIPRAASPALASACAVGVSGARLALLLARGIVVVRMTVVLPRQYERKPRPSGYQVPHSRLGSGRDGGFRKAGGLVKSSASNGVVAAASRVVSAGRFHFSSTSLSTEVWSRTSEQT